LTQAGLTQAGLTRAGSWRPEPAVVRATGYRYGDRVDGWVRPDYREPASEPVAAGEYWLPVTDPYADAGYGSPATTDTGAEHRTSASWSGPVTRYERHRRQVPRAPERDATSFVPYEVAPAVEPMPAPSFDAAAAFASHRPPVAAAHQPTQLAGDRTATTSARHEAPAVAIGKPPATEPAGHAIDSMAVDAMAVDSMAVAGMAVTGMAVEGTSADADADIDRSGQHFPRRRRAATVRRSPARTDAPPPVDPPIRTRVTMPRGETRRRIAVATEFIPTASDATQLLPTIPVIEGYGGSDPDRPDAARVRDPEVTVRPRPRPRPRPGGSTQGEDRQPGRSTVYVSRHAAEPS
jgi:hypothetical protein